jgi:hypothetical protein
MDATTMSQVGMSGGVVSILAVAFALFKWLNHRRFRSSCNGRVVEARVDVDTPEPAVVRVNPMIVPVPVPSA